MLPLHYFLLLKQTFCHKLLHPKNPKVIRLLLPGDWKTLSSRHRGLQLYGSHSHPIWLTQLSILEVQPLLLYLICTIKRLKIYMSCLAQFATTETTSIFPVYIFHTLIVIYQPLPRMEFIIHNSYTTLQLAVCIQTCYNVTVFWALNYQIKDF